MSIVGPDAQASLLSSSRLRDLFERQETCDAYVVSIDVRRSTELMLKAREPKLFAEFITTLADKLREIIIKRYGVFDKFTGDGILAYFPDFYSGTDAGLLVVGAAEECHRAFNEHYKDKRNSFLSVMRDVGLGIGIDYGKIAIVKLQGELTVVGTPVVYACRLGGANAGQTLANQPAYEVLIERFSEYIDFRETSISFKHEGEMIAYDISRNNKPGRDAAKPEWLTKESES